MINKKYLTISCSRLQRLQLMVRLSRTILIFASIPSDKAVVTDYQGDVNTIRNWYARLLPHSLLDFRLSCLKRIQPLFQIGHFLFDFA